MSPETKKCPYCAEEILAAAIKCKHCGELLGTPVNGTTKALSPIVKSVNLGSSNIVAIVSALIIAIGCFMPWIQLGALFKNRGIDGPDGAIMLVLAVIAGALGIFNQTKHQNKYFGGYLLIGVIGIIVGIIDLSDVTERSRKIVESLGAVSQYFDGSANISLFNFIGSGLYIVLLGSLGLVVIGTGLLKSKLLASGLSDEEKLTYVKLKNKIDGNLSNISLQEWNILQKSNQHDDFIPILIVRDKTQGNYLTITIDQWKEIKAKGQTENYQIYEGLDVS